MLSLYNHPSFHVSPFGILACQLLHNIASEIHTGTTLSLLKPDRLEAYPTFAMVGCAAKTASKHPTKNMNAKTHPSPAGAQTQRPGRLGQVPRRWLRVKRIFTFCEYRVQHLGCLDGYLPQASHLKPQASSLKPALPTPSPDEQNSGGGSPGRSPECPCRTRTDKSSEDTARGRSSSRRESRASCPP